MPYDISQYSPTYGGVINSSGNVVNVADSVDSNGFVKVNQQNRVSDYTAFQINTNANSNGSTIDVSSYSSMVLQITITGTATVNFEQSTDGTTWTAFFGRNINNMAVASTTAASSHFEFVTSGKKYVRARVSGYGSGTVTVQGYLSVGNVVIQSDLGQYGATDSNASTAQLQGVGAFNLFWDGSNWVRGRLDSNQNQKVANTVQSTTTTVTIATSGTTSGAIALNGNNLVGLLIPSTWDGGNITIQGCDTVSGTYVDVYDSNGSIATVTVGGASRIVGLTGSFMQAVANIPFIKLKTASAVAATRTIVILQKG